MRTPLAVTVALAAVAAVTLPIAASATDSGQEQPAATPVASSQASAGAETPEATGLDIQGLKKARAEADALPTEPSGVRKVSDPKPISGSADTMFTGTRADVPEAYSLEKFAPTPGSQARTNSCVAWATGYTGYGVIMNEMKINDGPMAPMYIYSQATGGRDTGTWAAKVLPLLFNQGIDTKAHYQPQGDYNFWTMPTQSQRQNAGKYKLTGYWDLTKMPDRKQAVKEGISRGTPIPVAFYTTPSFMRLRGQTYNPSPNEGRSTGHEVTIIGYDQEGVILQNSWGPQWNGNGRFKASWNWLQSRDIMEIHAMGALEHR